jgi:peroxiredoxin (alkyl hydroperoxide reductase subunit C)
MVRSAMVNDLPLGRNLEEILRLLDALQQVEQYGDVCPANWHVGDDTMKATHEGLTAYAKTHVA